MYIYLGDLSTNLFAINNTSVIVKFVTVLVVLCSVYAKSSGMEPNLLHTVIIVTLNEFHITHSNFYP